MDICNAMAFRAEEEQQRGRQKAVEYLVSKHLSQSQREEGLHTLETLMMKLGPVIDYYPSWHPLVSCGPKRSSTHPFTLPNHETGYEGLDHTIYFRNGFITCPYSGVERILKSVENLCSHPVASITAEALDIPLYSPNAKPVVVTCEWDRPMDRDGTVPKSIATALMLEEEVPGWRTSKVAETWETMRPYILGRPRGSLSSLFVNQATGQVLKNIYNALIYTGMYGPIMVDG